MGQQDGEHGTPISAMSLLQEEQIIGVSAVDG
jgi:hypothetical protein